MSKFWTGDDSSSEGEEDSDVGVGGRSCYLSRDTTGKTREEENEKEEEEGTVDEWRDWNTVKPFKVGFAVENLATEVVRLANSEQGGAGFVRCTTAISAEKLQQQIFNVVNSFQSVHGVYFEKLKVAPTLELVGSREAVGSTGDHIRVHLVYHRKSSQPGSDKVDGLAVHVTPLPRRAFATLTQMKLSREAHSTEAIDVSNLARQWATFDPIWGRRGTPPPPHLRDLPLEPRESEPEPLSIEMARQLEVEGTLLEYKLFPCKPQYGWPFTVADVTTLVMEHIARHFSCTDPCELVVGVEDKSRYVTGLRFAEGQDTPDARGAMHNNIRKAVRSLAFPPLNPSLVSVSWEQVTLPTSWESDHLLDRFELHLAPEGAMHAAIEVDLTCLAANGLPERFEPPDWWPCGGDEMETKAEDDDDDDSGSADGGAQERKTAVQQRRAARTYDRLLLVPKVMGSYASNLLPKMKQFPRVDESTSRAIADAFSYSDMLNAATDDLKHKWIVRVNLAPVPDGTPMPVVFAKVPQVCFEWHSVETADGTPLVPTKTRIGNTLIPHPLDLFNRVRVPCARLRTMLQHPGFIHHVVGSLDALPSPSPGPLSVLKQSQPWGIGEEAGSVLDDWELESLVCPTRPVCLWAVLPVLSETVDFAKRQLTNMAQHLAQATSKIQRCNRDDRSEAVALVRVCAVLVVQSGEQATSLLTALDEQDTAIVRVIDVVTLAQLNRVLSSADVSPGKDQEEEEEQLVGQLGRIPGCEVVSAPMSTTLATANAAPESPPESRTSCMSPSDEDAFDAQVREWFAHRSLTLDDEMLDRGVAADSAQFRDARDELARLCADPATHSELLLQKLSPCCGASTVLAQLRHEHIARAQSDPGFKLICLHADSLPGQDTERLQQVLLKLLTALVQEAARTILVLMDEGQDQHEERTLDDIMAGLRPPASSSSAAPRRGRVVLVRVMPVHATATATATANALALGGGSQRIVWLTSQLRDAQDFDAFVRPVDRFFRSHVNEERGRYLDDSDAFTAPCHHVDLVVLGLCQHYGCPISDPQAEHAGVTALVDFAFDKSHEPCDEPALSTARRWWWSVVRVLSFLTVIRAKEPYPLSIPSGAVGGKTESYKQNVWCSYLLGIEKKRKRWRFRLLMPILARAILLRCVDAEVPMQASARPAAATTDNVDEWTTVADSAKESGRARKHRVVEEVGACMEREMEHALQSQCTRLPDVVRFVEHVLVKSCMRDVPELSHFTFLSQLAVDGLVFNRDTSAELTKNSISCQQELWEWLVSQRTISEDQLLELVCVQNGCTGLLDRLLKKVVGWCHRKLQPDPVLAEGTAPVQERPLPLTEKDMLLVLATVPHWNMLKSRIWEHVAKRFSGGGGSMIAQAKQRARENAWSFNSLACWQVEILRDRLSEDDRGVALAHNSDTTILKHYASCSARWKKKYEKAYEIVRDIFPRLHNKSEPLWHKTNQSAASLIREARDFLQPWGQACTWLDPLLQELLQDPDSQQPDETDATQTPAPTDTGASRRRRETAASAATMNDLVRPDLASDSTKTTMESFASWLQHRLY